MNHDEKELRDLDLWIAEHVMAYTRGHPGGCAKEYWQPPPYKFGVIPVEKVPKFTTNPADAMAVLEKCAEKCTVTIECAKNASGDWQAMVSRLNQEGRKTVEDFCKVADTLPLAICLFSKKIFAP